MVNLIETLPIQVVVKIELNELAKKYQWMAMYEVVARVADNFEMTDPSTRWKDDKKYLWYNGSVEPSFRDIDPTFIPPDSTNIRLITPLITMGGVMILKIG
ncbi:hypothetical protein PKHYL_16070 [Psychrobacter sp. KH172YL61]|nr:hypothetical protein PKHYL_16070 [Psychrobacter sp. KH172YL61]